MMETRCWDDIAIGDPVSPIMFEITALKAAMVPAVSLDQFAAHYDIDVAKGLGLEALSMNTMELIGLANRYATDWAGPGAFIMRQDIKIMRPAYQGYRLTVSGEVVGGWEDPDDPQRSGCVEISCRTTNDDGLAIIEGTLVLALPRRRRPAA